LVNFLRAELHDAPDQLHGTRSGSGNRIVPLWTSYGASSSWNAATDAHWRDTANSAASTRRVPGTAFRIALRTPSSIPCTAAGCEAVYSSTDSNFVLAILGPSILAYSAPRAVLWPRRYRRPR